MGTRQKDTARFKARSGNLFDYSLEVKVKTLDALLTHLNSVEIPQELEQLRDAMSQAREKKAKMLRARRKKADRELLKRAKNGIVLDLP